MNITQTFYDNMASQYDKLFFDWKATTQEQAVILNNIFHSYGFDKTASVLESKVQSMIQFSDCLAA